MPARALTPARAARAVARIHRPARAPPPRAERASRSSCIEVFGYPWIGAPGLRRLLDFSASVQDFGAAPALLPTRAQAPQLHKLPDEVEVPITIAGSQVWPRS